MLSRTCVTGFDRLSDSQIWTLPRNSLAHGRRGSRRLYIWDLIDFLCLGWRKVDPATIGLAEVFIAWANVFVLAKPEIERMYKKKSRPWCAGMNQQGQITKCQSYNLD